MPRTPPTDPMPDVFETFPDRVVPEEAPPSLDAGTVARSAGIWLALTVVAALAFVGGLGWGIAHPIGVSFDGGGTDGLFYEGLVKVTYAVSCGLGLAAAVLAVTLLVLCLPWARRRQHAERG